MNRRPDQLTDAPSLVKPKDELPLKAFYKRERALRSAQALTLSAACTALPKRFSHHQPSLISNQESFFFYSENFHKILEDLLVHSREALRDPPGRRGPLNLSPDYCLFVGPSELF